MVGRTVFRTVAQVNQLVFQPALDPLHAAFRILRLRSILSESPPLHVEHVRILDFFLLFPFRIRSLRLAPSHQHYKALAEKYAHLAPYGEQPDSELLFERMKPMQIAALETLALRGYIDEGSFKAGIFKPTQNEIPIELADRISRINYEQSDLVDFLRILATGYDVSGENGLKARSQLMDSRYDAI